MKIQIKYVTINLSQNICQTNIYDDVIIKFSKFRIFCIFSLLQPEYTICKIKFDILTETATFPCLNE